MRRDHLNDAIEAAFDRRDFRAALELVEAALPDLRAQGEMSDEFLIALENKARAHFSLNDFPAALEVDLELLRLDGEKNGFVDDNYVRDLGNVAFVQFLLRRPEAESNLNRALELVQQCPEPHGWLYSHLLIYQSRLQSARGEIRPALRSILAAARDRRQYFYADSVMLADVFLSLSRLYERHGQFESAARIMRKVIRLISLDREESASRLAEMKDRRRKLEATRKVG